MSVDTQETTTSLTAKIVAAHVSHNSVAVADVPALIRSVFGALAATSAPPQQAQPEKPKGAVLARASIKRDRLISMINGKPYKTLRRHIAKHGYTAETYREAFGLPSNYPMVSSDYAEQRRAVALKSGLGRRAEMTAESEPGGDTARPEEPAPMVSAAGDREAPAGPDEASAEPKAPKPAKKRQRSAA